VLFGPPGSWSLSRPHVVLLPLLHQLLNTQPLIGLGWLLAVSGHPCHDIRRHVAALLFSLLPILLLARRRWVHKTHLRGFTGRNLGNQVMGEGSSAHKSLRKWLCTGLFYTKLRNVPHLDAPTTNLYSSIWVGNIDCVSSARIGDQCTLLLVKLEAVCTTEMETYMPSLRAKLRVFLATSQKTILITRNTGKTSCFVCDWLD
jgi:hypothetical protein